MSPTLILILVLVVLLVVGIGIFLFVVLRRARKVAYSADPAMTAEADKKDPAPGEFLSYAANLELRSSFRRAIRLLRNYVTGRDYRYRVPWFLMTGESDSGKTTLLQGNGTNLSVEEGNEDNQLVNWYFFNEGVVIDVAGDFVLRRDGTANHRGWNTISRLLVKHRPRRPLDGVVLTIPASDLCTDEPDLKNERRFKLEQKATALYKKLWQSQRILGMRLPVYILITKCDEIPGFTDFCEQLPDQLQTQMFGWSNDRTLETSYNPDLVPEAFTSLYQHLSALQFEIYTEREHIENADDIFLLPSLVDSMRAPLQVYLDVFFKQSAYHEPFFFRGIYLCGEPPGELLLESAETDQDKNWTEPFALKPTPPEPSDYFERNPAFVSDLFKEKIFAEDFLAQPVRRTALSRNRTVIAAQVLSLLIIFGGGVGLAQAYYRMSQQRDNLSQFLAVEAIDLRAPAKTQREPTLSNRDENLRSIDPAALNASGSGLDRRTVPYEDRGANASSDALVKPLRSGASNLLDAMSRMSGRRFGSFFIPASWFSSINERLQRVVTGAFSKVVFEDLRTDLLKQSDSLLIESSVSPNRCARNDRNPRLPQFIEQLGELRSNLEKYDTLVQKGSGSLENLNQLVVYLCHNPLPAGFDEDNELYQRALAEAQGKQIDTRAIFADMVDTTAAQIEDLYEKSFDRKSVKYDKLDEIAEAEGLLRRPEYTWLATSVVDPHSQFHPMTISSALIDLRQALQDLRRQRFMAPTDLFDSGMYGIDDRPRFQHRRRSVLVWDQESLRQAIAVYEQYQTFVATKSYDPWRRLDDSAKNTALNQIRSRITNILKGAQRYEPVPAVIEGSALRASLVEEVRLLQQAQPLLSKVLQITQQLGIDRQLRSALYSQGSHLLGGIHREFVSQRFYISKRADRMDGRLASDFSWWDGAQPVSYLTYDLGGKEELSFYLNTQRKNIAFLARDLYIPASTFFASQRIQVESSGQVDWVQMLADLDAYDNKTPGNPIAALENFLRADMDRVSVDSCYDLTRIPDEPSSNYFLNIRNSLRSTFYERCIVLARIKAINDAAEALKNYGAIEKSFNDNLGNGFPYGDVNSPPLDPWAMVKFFKVLAEKEKAAREALDRSEKFGARPQAAREFLDQMARAHDFFAAFLEKKQGPAYDFKIQFRVNREEEIAGNQIIDWKLEVGKKKFSYVSDDLAGRWTYGEPVRLTLRWANDSPTRPVMSAAPMPVVVKERQAIIEYNDRWSLFTLLLTHGSQLKRAGAPGECDNGYDPDPYTLKFIIKTEMDPVVQPGQPNDLTPPNAEVFMRVTLMTANKPEPLMLPCLPTKAPPIPALFVSGLNTAENKDE